MATQVIKTDGSKVAFDPKKIIRGITRSAQDAGLPAMDIAKLVDEVSSKVISYAAAKEKVRSSEIKDMILAELDKAAPTVAQEWRKFSAKKR